MARVRIAAALLLLAAGGGMQFYTSALWAAVVGIGAVLLFTALLAGDDLRSGLALFGWYWPAAWLLLTTAGWWGNRNIVAVWSVLAVVALLGERGRWPWLAVAANGLLLLWLGSRGAMIGLWAAMLVMVWHWAAARRWLLALALVAPLALLWRPDTAIYRLWYWQQALAAWWSAPWLGVGYGGLQAGCWVPEPGGGCQIHAHNIFIHALAEFGLVGLGLLAVGLGLLAVARRPRWQWALLAALLVHSLVDLPLFWPGPLVFFVVLAIYPYQILIPYQKMRGVVIKKLVVSSYSRR